MPTILSPNSFGLVAIDQLAEDSLNTIAGASGNETPAGVRVSLLRPKGRQYGYAFLTQFIRLSRRPVIPVANQGPWGTFSKLWHNAEFVSIGGSHGEASDYPRPAQVYVDPEAVESLPNQSILSKGSFSAESLATVSSGELTYWKRKAINESKGRIGLDRAQQVLLHLLLDLPKVGGLANESGSMHPLQPRKEMPIMLAEVSVQIGILAAAQEFSHRFHGQYLGISQGRITPPPLAQALSLEKGLQSIIYSAKDCYDIRIQVHHTPR